MTFTTADGKICEGIEQGRFEPIAIVGIGALMPDADDVEAFWQNIIDAKVSIENISQDRWPGKIEHLDIKIIHNGMPSISKQLENLNRYTRYEADELKHKKIKFSMFRWILSPPLIFLKKYVLQQGFRDGWRGFFLAVYSAFYIFLSHAKLKEIEKGAKKGTKDEH